MINKKETINDLLQVLFSNGFPRLRICTIFDIGFSVCFNDTWTGSPTLRTLNLYMRELLDREQLRSVCPRLRRLTTKRFSLDEPLKGKSFVFENLSKDLFASG